MRGGAGVIDLDWSSEDLLAAGAVDGRIVVLGMDPPSEIAVPLGKRRVPSATPSLVSLKENEKTPEERGPSGSEHLAGGGGSGETREAQQEASTGEAEMKAADELKAEPGETPAGGEALVEETAEVASVRWDSTGKLLAVVDSSSSVGVSFFLRCWAFQRFLKEKTEARRCGACGVCTALERRRANAAAARLNGAHRARD